MPKTSRQSCKLLANKEGRRSGISCKMFANSSEVHCPKYNSKKFITFRISKVYIISKVSCLVSVSASSSLDLVSTNYFLFKVSVS